MPKTVAAVAQTANTVESSSLGLQNKLSLAREIQVSERTIEHWMQRGIIPYIRIGRTIRFDINRVKTALTRFEIREVTR